MFKNITLLPATISGVALLCSFNAMKAHAGVISFDLQLANPSGPIFRLQNTSPDFNAEITGFQGTVGDTTYNYDILSGFGTLIDNGNVLTSNLLVGDMNQGGDRTDNFAISFSGFESGDRFEVSITDIDLDNANTVEDFRTILFNNGTAPNAQFTVDFQSGIETESLTLILPDDPLIGDPQILNFSVTGNITMVPEPSSLLGFIGLGGFMLGGAIGKTKK